MNKTVAIIAAVLSLLTAFIIMDIGPGIDAEFETIGAYSYYVIDDADTEIYNDDVFYGVKSYQGRILIDSDIRDGAFAGCSSILVVYLGENVTKIGNGAFEGCSNLQTVNCDEGLRTIGDNAFKDSDVMDVNLPSTVTSIGKSAFEGCSRLRGAVLDGTSVTEIKDGTFRNSGIIVEDFRNVRSIASTAFSGTEMLVQILSEGQSVKLNGVQAVYVKDFDVYKVTYGTKLKEDLVNKDYYLQMNVDKGVSLMSRNNDGTYSLYDSKGVVWVNPEYRCNILLGGNDIHLEPVKYTIHFEDYLGMSDVIRRSGSGTYVMPTPTLATSIFKGWKIDRFSGYVTRLTESDFQTAGMTIYPVADYATLTMTFDHSQVSGAPGSSGLMTKMEFSARSVYPSLSGITGYSFSGWMDNGSFRNAGDPITNFTNHTVKSVWNAEMLTLTLNTYGGSTSQGVSAGSIIDLDSLIADELESKRFIGWSLAQNGTVMTSDPVMSSDVTFYAVYADRESHTVRYMDGDAVIDTQSGYHGRSIVIDVDDPVRDGRVFTGWKLGDTSVENGQYIVLDSDIEIISTWADREVNVTYRVDGNAVIAYEYGDMVTVGYDVQPVAGSTLGGWSVVQNGPVTYTDGSTFVITSNVILYPCWVSNGKLVVTLHDYLGRSMQTEVEPDSMFTIPDHTVREGKRFSGWAIVPAGEPAYNVGQSIRITDNTDLFEIWSDIVQYRLSMHHHDGTADDRMLESGSSFSLPAVGSRHGYEFKGWSTASGGNPVLRDRDTISVDRNMDVYEVWSQLETFTVTVHSNPVIEETAYVGEQVTVTLPSMSRTGYSMSGWSTVSGASVSERSVNSVVTSTTTVDYYPVWSAIPQYTVNVHLIGEDVRTYTVYSGSSVTLPESLGEIEGKTHEGWTEGSDGSGRFHAAGSTFVPQHDMELFLSWSDPLMVKLVLMDGDDAVETVSYQKGTVVDMDELRVQSKDGYFFLGWSESTSGAVGSIRIVMDSDRIVHALWERLVSVTFHGSDKEQVYYRIGDSVELESLEMDGFRFLGWSLSIEGDVIHSLKAVKDVDLYPIWEEVNSDEPVPERTASDGSGSGMSVTTMGIGAVVAGVVSTLMVIQMRRN